MNPAHQWKWSIDWAAMVTAETATAALTSETSQDRLDRVPVVARECPLTSSLRPH
jgi:hypothetical protein